MRFLKQFLPVMAVYAAGGQAVMAVEDNVFLTLVLGVATAALSLFVYSWTVRWSERRPVDELAKEGAARRVGLGLALGAGWCAMVIVNIAFLGDYHVDGFGSATGPIGLFGFMAAAAVTEELIFRGILFRFVEKWTGTWLALALTSLVFGLMHLANKDATLWGAIAIAIEAGATLAAAYAATRNLWIPIGLHFGWNFALAAVFGAEVSGNGDNEGLLKSATSGPTLVSGGTFGPEASGYTVVFGVLLTVAFMWLARKRGNVIPRRRTARAAATATLAQ
jgi:uncharacterized protein